MRYRSWCSTLHIPVGDFGDLLDGLFIVAIFLRQVNALAY